MSSSREACRPVPHFGWSPKGPGQDMATDDELVDVDFGQLTPVAPPEPAPSLEQAALHARRLRASAEAEAARVRDEARAAGHAEGFAVGRSEALAEMTPSVAAAASALEAVR